MKASNTGSGVFQQVGPLFKKQYVAESDAAESTLGNKTSSPLSPLEKLPQKPLMKRASLALNRDGAKLSGQDVLNVGDIHCLSKTSYNTDTELVPPYLLMQNIFHAYLGFYRKPSGFELKWHPKLAEILEAPATSALDQRLQDYLSRVEWIATNQQRWTLNHWKTFFPEVPFFDLFGQTREEHAQRLHQLAAKIQAGFFPNLNALYIYTLSTDDLIQFLDIAFPVQDTKANDPACVSSATTAKTAVGLQKLDFRTDNWNEPLLERIEILARQFPELRFGNGLGIHSQYVPYVTPDNHLLTLQGHTDYAFWDGETLSAEFRNKLLTAMRRRPESPMAHQANNITGYLEKNTGEPRGQFDGLIREMKQGADNKFIQLESVT